MDLRITHLSKILKSNPNQKIGFYKDENRTDIYSYSDLDLLSDTYAEVLRGTFFKNHSKDQSAIQKKVFISLENGAEFAIAFLALMKLQAIAIPLPTLSVSEPKFYRERLNQVLNKIESYILITDVTTVKYLDSHKSYFSNPIKFSEVKIKDLVTERLNVVGTKEHRDLKPSTSEDNQFNDSDEIALIQFSSGSTQLPKGVELTHRNILTNLEQISIGMDVQLNDIYAGWLPFYHDMGLIGGLLGTLYNGKLGYFATPVDFLISPTLWVRNLSKWQATVLTGPDFYYRQMTKKVKSSDLKDLDFSRVRVMMTGAELINAQTCKEFIEKYSAYGLNKDAFMPVYGLAENSLAVTFSPAGRGVRIDQFVNGEGQTVESVSTGYPLKSIKLKIVKDNYEDAVEREIGEIYIKSPSMTNGYFNDAQNTNGLFEGAWLKTGDLGYLFEGELFIVGRKKELIKLNGKSYFPADLEKEIYSLGKDYAIARIAALSVWMPKSEGGKTEEVHVVVESKELSAARRNQLRGQIISVLAKHILISEEKVHLVPACSIPRTSSGKTQRYKLAEQILNQSLDVLESQFTRISLVTKVKRVFLYKELLFRIAKNVYFSWKRKRKLNQIDKSIEKKLVQEIEALVVRNEMKKNKKVDLDRPISESGLDSISLIELNQKVKDNWGIEISLLEFIQFKTLKDIKNHIVDRLAKGQLDLVDKRQEI